jgi:putative sterol carrier protein
VPQYLSDEWIQSVNEALAASDAVATATRGQRVVIQQLIDSGPDGEKSSYLRIDDGTVALVEGVAPDADVTVRTDYETSQALQKGELDAMTAVMSGRIKPQGNLAKLMGVQAAMTVVDELTKSVDTTYETAG